MQKDPWYKNVSGPFLQWQGPVGIKADGGGCTRGQGRVGGMAVHRAAFNRDKDGAWGGRRGARAPSRAVKGSTMPLGATRHPSVTRAACL